MCFKCLRCGEENKKANLRIRTNYPFGRKSKGRTTYFCNCGGLCIEKKNL